MALTQRPDADISRDVSETLAWDSRLDDREVQVAVAGGVVSLSGTVPTLAQKLIAAEDAWRVKGVREVVNQLEVRAEPERTNEEVAAEIYRALEADPRIGERNVVVQVSGGVVRLTGTVASAIERQGAAEHVWHVSGVVDVLNELVVVPSRQRPPQEIERDVREALLRDARLADPTEISVGVKDGTVELRGRVQNERERRAAEEDAWFTAGVARVQDNLTTQA